MAKLSELSDGQLEKAFIRYSQAHKKAPTDQTKKVLQGIQIERKKRQGAVQSDSEPISDLAALSRSAEASVKKKRQKQQKAYSKSQKIPRKGQGPALELKKGNLLLGFGLVSGLLGLILLADDFLLGWLPSFPMKMFAYSFLLIAGVVACKLSSLLMDDNR